MARPRPKRPNPKKASPRKPSSNAALIKRLRASPWKVLRVLLLAAVVAAIILFRSLLGSIVFEAIGFAIVLALLWLGAVVWMVWQRRIRTALRWWNFWLGAVLLSLAVWGILALFRPSALTISDVKFAEVSLGGTVGEYFIGNQGVGVLPWARLVVLILLGIGLMLPYPSFRFLRRLAVATRAAVAATIAGGRWVLPRLARNLAGVYHRYPVHRLPSAAVVAVKETVRRQRMAGLPDTAKALPADRVASGFETGRTAATGIQLPLEPTVSTEDVAGIGLDLEGTKPLGTHAASQQLPPIHLLDRAAEVVFTEADNEQRAKLIEDALGSYGVEAKVVQVNPGPSVTQFGIEPGWARKYRRIPERDQQGKVKLDKDGNPIERLEEVSKTRIKVERITALANDLALALATPSIRIEAPVPGKPVVGIEVPNTTTSLVRLRGVIESSAFQKIRARSQLAIALGNGAAGEPVAADLSRMPHLLIAGTTGSGKTVCINSIISCLLMSNTPQDMRVLLIDPKRVELVSFNGVPHLISPVVVDVEKAIESLRRLIREMDIRFSKFAAVGVRNIEAHNRSPLVSERMPYLVVIVDELADLMMTAAEVVEPAICRLAQLSRATGIHLILATQRPSVDVVTGLIKANFPSRISFAVASAVDSRTILDISGAEKLLGQGDMLYMPSDAAKPKRLRGCFVSDQEIERLVKFWRDQHDPHVSHLEDAVAQAFASLETEELRGKDPLLPSARRLAQEHSHLSTSLLQRRLHIGYPRAARIMDALEEEGVVVRGGEGEAYETDEEEEE